jgi:hypothetical protein
MNTPQTEETWICAVRQLRLWLAETPPTRPYLCLAAETGLGQVRLAKPARQAPTPETLLKLLREAMQAPAGGRAPGRPRRIYFEIEAEAQALAAALEEMGVAAVYQAEVSAALGAVVDHIAGDFTALARGGQPELPGLLGSGIDPEQAGALFAAAAAFYRRTDWAALLAAGPQVVTPPAGAPQRYLRALAEPQGAYALAISAEAAALAKLTSLSAAPAETLPEGLLALWFDDVSALPFDDGAAQAEHGWPIAGERAYPVPVVYTQGGAVGRPSPVELAWLTGWLTAQH